MVHLSRRYESLPREMGMGPSGERVVNVVGLAGLALIALFLVGCLTLIPDFLRYMRIKNM